MASVKCQVTRVKWQGSSGKRIYPPRRRRLCRRGYHSWLVLLGVCLLALLAGQVRAESDDYVKLTERIKQLQSNDCVTLTQIGASIKGRPIYSIIITNRDNSECMLENRIRLVVLSTQHGNEPLPAYASLDLAESLAHKKPDFLKRIAIAFVPVVNPDGFVAKKRQNAAGTDLNRNWASHDQPETIAVTRFIKEFSPHVLIDEHEWMNDDNYRPDCVETPGFGHQANERLARRLAQAAPKLIGSCGLRLRQTSYRAESEPGMAHRWFVNSGICSMLVETSPKWQSSDRCEAYNAFVKTVISSLSSPPDLIVKNDLDVLLEKHRDAGRCWALGVRYRPENQHPTPNTQHLWLVLITAAVFLITRVAAPKLPIKHTQANPRKINPKRRRMLSLTDTVRCDLSIHTRLVLIQNSRSRPSDRTQTKEHPTSQNSPSRQTQKNGRLLEVYS